MLLAVKDRQGPKVDVTMSRVADPASIPEPGTGLPQTMWRIDRLREMTYTQFWHLIQERQIVRVCSNTVSAAAACNPSFIKPAKLQHQGYVAGA